MRSILLSLNRLSLFALMLGLGLSGCQDRRVGAARTENAEVQIPRTEGHTDRHADRHADLGPSEEQEVEPHAHFYSPFALRMRTPGLPFSVISFKDVGMSIPEPDRAFVYEGIAEGLAHALTHAGEGPMSSEVQHRLAVADPNNHLHCEGAHIYVDLWRETEGWGYSLWSGCGEDDEFAHRAVTASVEHVRLASLEPLTRDIADRLRDAVRTGCFTRNC